MTRATFIREIAVRLVFEKQDLPVEAVTRATELADALGLTDDAAPAGGMSRALSPGPMRFGAGDIGVFLPGDSARGFAKDLHAHFETLRVNGHIGGYQLLQLRTLAAILGIGDEDVGDVVALRPFVECLAAKEGA